MKQLSILTSILFAIIFMFTACSEESATELLWVNDSGAAINDIVWADGDAVWTAATGYADGNQTEVKEVSALSGGVTCAIDNGADFEEASVVITETNTTSCLLAEGNLNSFTIVASKK